MTAYSVRIDFDKKTDNPERVFYAMALYVEGFNEIQSAFANGLCDGIKIETSLERTPEGSLIAKIKQIYKATKSKSQALCIDLKKYQESHYASLREEISTLEVVDSKGDVERFVNSINERIAANNDEYNNLIVPSAPNLYQVASGLHKLDKAKRKLKPTDKVEFGDDRGLKPINEKFSCPRTADKIFEVKKKLYPSTDILIIRKPDYLNDGSPWVFENITRKNKNFIAKMNDHSWLNRWQNHEVQIWPNYALQAKVVTHYGKSCASKDTYCHEIIEVLDVLDNDDVKQYKIVLDQSSDG
ncbi:hypothetical protein [Photobacterium phosphoreum]|uniref:hypothetical protein n=1 Tax=Photobacterium phosphoreum TaxID=659 RepID=UPI0024B7E830|nr:hypothetical protein [Photobacterium phosphoreum]